VPPPADEPLWLQFWSEPAEPDAEPLPLPSPLPVDPELPPLEPEPEPPESAAYADVAVSQFCPALSPVDDPEPALPEPAPEPPLLGGGLLG
jgi:hypothetical protein